jgi:hypothetical protein
MRARMMVSVPILAFVLGGAAAGSVGCGDSNEPGDICDAVGLSESGRSLLAPCCARNVIAESNVIGSGNITCSDNQGCEVSWSYTLERDGSGVITSYTATHNGETTCSGP